MDPTPPQPPPSVLSSMATDDHSKDPEPIVETHISTRSTEVDAEAMKKAKRELVNRLLSARRLLAQPGYALHSIPEEEASGRMMESVSSGARSFLRHPVDAFLRQNVRELHQASSSPIRTEKDLTRRSEPYRSPGAGPAKRRNKKATPPAMQPTGELISESTADPKTDRRIKEGDKPVSSFYRSRVPHLTRWSIQKSKRRHQQEQENEKELCDLVMRWKGLTNRPTKTETLACKHMSHGAE